MGVAAIIAKIMPDSPEANLEEIQKKAKEKLEAEGSQNISFETKDIAFGLKAVMVKFAWPEEKDTELVESTLSSIEHVSSATIDDYRRAFG
jgi:translation elongation factor aEF-1 beta